MKKSFTLVLVAMLTVLFSFLSENVMAQCNPISVTVASPYNEDFTGYTAVSDVATAGTIPTCWDYIYSGTSENYEPKVFNGTYTPIASNNAIEITSGGTSLFGFITLSDAGTNNYVILPEFANGLDELQIVFSTAMSTDTAGALTLGFMTDPADANTFTDIAAIPSNYYATDRYVMHSFTLGNYPQCANMHARLAFRWSDASRSATSTVCIDDISVRIKLNCEDPSNLYVYGISPNSAILDWIPGADQQEWELDCNGTRQLITTRPYTLTGLTPTTQYTVSLRGACAANDSSYWSTPVTFTSACPINTVDDNTPFTETFATNSLNCWFTDITAGSDDWEITNSAHSGTYGVTYSNSLFGDLLGTTEPSIMDILSMFGNMMNFGTGSSYLISPIMDLTGLTMPARLTFYRRQTSSMVPLTLQVYFRTSPTGNWGWLAQYNTTSSTWNLESISLPNPSAEYQIAFLSIVDMSNMGDIMDMSSMMDPNATFDLASVIDLDDIRVGASTECDVPASVLAYNIGNNSATVSWVPGNASSWEIEYGQTGFAHGNGTTATTSNHLYTLTGLSPQTSYDVYVRGDCGNSIISDWSPVTQFTTTYTGINGYSLNARVVPNPATDHCTVECAATFGSITLYDVCGQQVLSTRITGQSTDINLNNLSEGIYMLRITADDHTTATVKIIKK